MANRLTKRTRRIPKKELFNIQKRILILIFKENKESLNKNKICNRIAEFGKEEGQTGWGFKLNVLDSIFAIQGMGLVKIEEEGAQKENIVLTQVGKELAELVVALENYNIAYFKLLELLHKKVFFVPIEIWVL